VFTIDTRGSTGDGNEPAYRSTFPVDFALAKDIDSGTNWTAKTRLLQGKDLNPNTNSATQGANYNKFDYMNGHFARTNTASDERSWMWKRARGYFDISMYSGTGSAQNISHNLGVVPEMMWIKRTDSTGSWNVYHKGLNGGTNPEQHVIYLEVTESSNSGGSAVFNNTAPTSSVFTVNTNNGVNNSSGSYIAYLFATASGVSKVGSYSGTGSSQNIDCGFTAGSSFVLVKRYDGTDSWYIADSARGISSGQTDKIIKLNSTDAEFTESENSADYIASHASGFNLPTSSPFNGSGDDFIFYAIAATS